MVDNVKIILMTANLFEQETSVPMRKLGIESRWSLVSFEQ
jgi:hypothetical protein